MIVQCAMPLEGGKFHFPWFINRKDRSIQPVLNLFQKDAFSEALEMHLCHHRRQYDLLEHEELLG